MPALTPRASVSLHQVSALSRHFAIAICVPNSFLNQYLGSPFSTSLQYLSPFHLSSFLLSFKVICWLNTHSSWDCFAHIISQHFLQLKLLKTLCKYDTLELPGWEGRVQVGSMECWLIAKGLRGETVGISLISYSCLRKLTSIQLIFFTCERRGLAAMISALLHSKSLDFVMPRWAKWMW